MPKVKVDKDKLNKRTKMKLGGLTYQEIADIEGVSKQAIQQQLTDFVPNLGALETYKKHRADILAAKQVELLHALTKDKIKDASALQLITGMGILTDKERLERGQSTQNVETIIHSLTNDRDDIARQIAELKGDIVTNK